MKKTHDPVEAQQTPTSSDPIEHGSFRAMGIDVLLLGSAVDASAVDKARAIFEEAEKRFSRFLPDSELSLLNSRAADRARISSEMYSILRTCRRMQAATGGVFDPGILVSLERLEQERQLKSVGSQRRESQVPRSITEVTLDDSKLLAKMPDGVRLDLGGVLQGWALDSTAEALASLTDFTIDAGGDIVARGSGPAGGGWLVAVAHPTQPGSEAGRAILKDSAIATSSTLRHRWRHGDAEMHDIIDPRNGEPAQTDCLSVSVIAPTAVEADVYAKSALILGLTAGRSLLKARGYAGLFVLGDGSVEVTEGWEGS